MENILPLQFRYVTVENRTVRMFSADGRSWFCKPQDLRHWEKRKLEALNHMKEGRQASWQLLNWPPMP
jgi:hypothetical protein